MRKTMMRKSCGNMMSASVLAVGLFVAGRALAGSLDPTNAPGPTMHTLEEIYQKQADTYQKVDAFVSPQTLSATTAVVRAGYYAATNLAAVDADLAAGNIKTNVTIFGLAGSLSTNASVGTNSAAVPKTGQTVSYAAEDDGWNSTNKGVAWPNPRFAAVATEGAETNQIRDNLTGLIWARNADFAGGTKTWWEALDYIAATNASGTLYGGTNDWRLPNKRELYSLISFQYVSPCLSDGTGTNKWSEALGPFTGVRLAEYWSSTPYAANAGYAWYVFLNLGDVWRDDKSISHYVWPVRGGR